MYTKSANRLSELGLNDHESAFKKHWLQYGFNKKAGDGYGNVTESVQSMLERTDTEELKGMTAKGIENMTTKQNDTTFANDLTNNIPVQFDPEIIQIQTENAPLLNEVPQEGWSHYTVAVNNIANRESAIGYQGEVTSTDLSGESGRDADFDKITSDMKIYVDKMEISDFSQAVGEGYMNVRETVMGTRVAEHAQNKEQTLLYGDPQAGVDDGSPHSTYAFKGLASWFDNAGNTKDKSSVDTSGTDALLKDIKAEVKELLQDAKNINKGDLKIFTSYSLKDILENEGATHSRMDFDADSVNYGTEDITISGIPLHTSHNVDDWSSTWGGTDNYPGYEGDVFIVDERATRFRNLAPLSTVPLGRDGLAELAALYEFGTFVERSDGEFGKYLYDYQI